MANLSNINNILRTNSTGVGIFDDAVSYPLEISSATTAGMRLINTAGATYDVYGNTSEEFLITKVGVGERLKIASGGAITFNNAYTFPTAVTTTNNYVLTAQTDGSTAWAAEGSTGTVKGTGTATRVAFWSASDTLSSNADLYWDNVNDRLGIGTITPSSALHVEGDSDTNSEFLTIEDSDSTAGSSTPKIQFRSVSAAIGSIRGHDVRGLQLGGGTNTQDLTIDPSGNVGIGTTSPGNLLDVAGDTDISGQLFVQHSGSYIAKLKQLATSMSNATYTFQIDSTAHSSNLSTAGAMSVDVYSGRAFTINGQGNVGIGTDSPFAGAELDVYGDIVLMEKNWALRGNNASADFAIEELIGTSFSDANIKFYIKSGGNVGIGTTSPTYPLEVDSGSNTVTGAYILGGKNSAGEIQNTGLIIGSYSDMSTGDYIGISFTGMTKGSSATGPARGRAAIGAKSMNGASGMDLVFMTRNAGDGTQLSSGDTKMTIEAGGNVGIGTDAPGAQLHIYNASAGNAEMKLEATSGGDPTITFNNTSANRSGALNFQDNGTQSGQITYNHNGDYMRFYTGGASSAGHLELELNEANGAVFRTKVGIGTTSPWTALAVSGTTASNSPSIGRNSTSTTAWTTILTFTGTQAQMYSVLLGTGENGYSQMWRVSGSTAAGTPTCYFTMLGDSAHGHSKDAEFRISSGALQYKNISYTTSRVLYVFDVVQSGGGSYTY